MNSLKFPRLLVKTAQPGGCVVCGDVRQVRVDVQDFGIVGVFPCPMCAGDSAVREFLAPLMDYLARPGGPKPVIA